MLQPGCMENDFNPPDGGWGWIVCLASFWTNGTIFGILNTFGILYVQMLKDWDTGEDPEIAFKICKNLSRSIITLSYFGTIYSVPSRRGDLLNLYKFFGFLVLRFSTFFSTKQYNGKCLDGQMGPLGGTANFCMQK